MRGGGRGGGRGRQNVFILKKPDKGESVLVDNTINNASTRRAFATSLDIGAPCPNCGDPPSGPPGFIILEAPLLLSTCCRYPCYLSFPPQEVFDNDTQGRMNEITPGCLFVSMRKTHK